jgi:hypothetical protein
MGFDQEALGEYNQRFNNQLNEFKSGPKQQRSCMDIFFVLIFVAITISFVVFGIYFLA